MSIETTFNNKVFQNSQNSQIFKNLVDGSATWRPFSLFKTKAQSNQGSFVKEQWWNLYGVKSYAGMDFAKNLRNFALQAIMDIQRLFILLNDYNSRIRKGSKIGLG